MPNENQNVTTTTNNAKPGEGGGAAAAPPAPQGYVSREEVDKMIRDGIQSGIANIMNQQRQQATSNAHRDSFVGTRLKNFPAAYVNKLGSDPAKWEEEAKQIESDFKADAQKFGWKIPNVGGDQPGGTSPINAPVANTGSATENIAQGMREHPGFTSSPQRSS